MCVNFFANSFSIYLTSVHRFFKNMRVTYLPLRISNLLYIPLCTYLYVDVKSHCSRKVENGTRRCKIQPRISRNPVNDQDFFCKRRNSPRSRKAIYQNTQFTLITYGAYDAIANYLKIENDIFRARYLNITDCTQGEHITVILLQKVSTLIEAAKIHGHAYPEHATL